MIECLKKHLQKNKELDLYPHIKNDMLIFSQVFCK